MTAPSPGTAARLVGPALALLLGSAPRPAPAEQGVRAALVAGRIVGRVVDAQTGAPRSDVGVQEAGTRIGATTGIDGGFTVAGGPAGTVTLDLRRVGCQPKTVTGLQLAAGLSLERDAALQPATTLPQAAVVTASAERGTVNGAHGGRFTFLPYANRQ